MIQIDKSILEEQQRQAEFDAVLSQYNMYRDYDDIYIKSKKGYFDWLLMKKRILYIKMEKEGTVTNFLVYGSLSPAIEIANKYQGIFNREVIIKHYSMENQVYYVD